MRLFSKPNFLKQKISAYIQRNLKDRSTNTLRLWTNQCEYIVAQKLRRGQQLITLYSRIWDEQALREILLRFHKQLAKHTRGMLLGSGGLFLFDWDNKRIALDTIRPHFNDVDEIGKLTRETIVCVECKKRILFDSRVKEIEYCSCKLKRSLSSMQSVDGWTPYVERSNMIVWRKEESPGLYAYKVYVVYDDITARDFLHVQIDTNYRKEWDNTAVKLEVIDSDPINESESQIIYWEMLWPKLFSNRDYVYNRRYVVDDDKKIMLIVNKSCEHPNCPPTPQNQRVKDYWSYMVVKPKTNFESNGLEFVLTYYDNPGVCIPPTITSWVAQKQMPDFIEKLHFATVKYAELKMVTNNDQYKIKDHHQQTLPEEWRNMGNNDERGKRAHQSSTPQEEFQDGDSSTKSKATSWWSYLHPYYYFA